MCVFQSIRMLFEENQINIDPDKPPLTMAVRQSDGTVVVTMDRNEKIKIYSESIASTGTLVVFEPTFDWKNIHLCVYHVNL